MREPAFKLVDEIKPDVDAWLKGDDIAILAKHQASIDAAGREALLAAVFLRFADATLSGWLLCLVPVWKDFSFASWKEVLYQISGDAPAVYQFVLFANEYLGIDSVRIIHEDPAVNATARSFAAEHFPHGGPAPGSEWVRERLEDNGVDQQELWTRLAAEGAPILGRGDDIGTGDVPNRRR